MCDQMTYKNLIFANIEGLISRRFFRKIFLVYDSLSLSFETIYELTLLLENIVR